MHYYKGCNKIFRFRITVFLSVLLLMAGNLHAQTTRLQRQLSAIPAIQQVISDSIKLKYSLPQTDGIPAILFQPDTSKNEAHKKLYEFIKQKTGARNWQNLTSDVKNINVLQQDKKLLSTLLPGMYALRNNVTNLKQGLFQKTSIGFQNAEINMIAGDQFSLIRGYTSTINIGASLHIAGVPLTGSIQTGYPSFFEQQPSAMFKYSFDREQFYNSMKKGLNDQFDLHKYALAGFNFEKILKDYAVSLTQQLQEELIATAGKYPFLNNIKNLSAEEILYLSTEQLESKIFAQYLTNQTGTNEQDAVLISDSLNVLIQNCRANIISMKKQFGRDGINMNAVVEYQQKVNRNIDSLTNSSEFIKKSAKELLPMSGLSRFFTKITDFQFGQFSPQWSKQTLSGVFMSGISGGFQNKNLFTGISVFENRLLGSVKDNQFNSLLFDPNQLVQSLRMGGGNIQSDHTHATVTNGKTVNRNNNAANHLLTIPRNSLAGTLSHQTDLGKAGIIHAEISKSSSGYQNAVNNMNDPAAAIQSSVSGFLQDFWQTVAVGLNYKNRYEKIALDHEIMFNYSGMGYSNPGMGFTPRGTLSAGTSLKKSFYQNKAQLQVRYQKRNNYTATDNNRFYSQDRMNFTGRIRFSNKLKAGVTLNSVNMSRVEDKAKTVILKQMRVNADLNFRGKINRTPIMQYAAVGYQDFSMPVAVGDLPGKMLMINSSTNLSCSKFQVQANMQYLKEPSFANNQKDLFTADAGISFSMLKNVQSTASLTYLAQNTNIMQAGIRSSVTGQFAKRWQFSLFGDLRKNLVTNNNPLFFPSSRGEIMIQYLIQ